MQLQHLLVADSNFPFFQIKQVKFATNISMHQLTKNIKCTIIFLTVFIKHFFFSLNLLDFEILEGNYHIAKKTQKAITISTKNPDVLFYSHRSLDKTEPEISYGGKFKWNFFFALFSRYAKPRHVPYGPSMIYSQRPS